MNKRAVTPQIGTGEQKKRKNLRLYSQLPRRCKSITALRITVGSYVA
jgi:hypothetical protein